MVRAAVLTKHRQPLEIVDIEVSPPRRGEVLIRMGASGICHSDYSVRAGDIPFTLPIVIGHEGAGIVDELGEGVDNLAVGDHVVLSCVPQCGSCWYCSHDEAFLCDASAETLSSGTLLDGTTRFQWRGEPVRQTAFMGSFSEWSVVPASATVKISSDIALTSAALLGCGVVTGFGAATNVAKVSPGESVAVLGCGGVGLNSIQGARIAGAECIIGIDRSTQKLETAKRFGATDVINITDKSPVSAVKALTRRGVDVAIDVVGQADTMVQASDMTRLGGRVVLVGVTEVDRLYPIPIPLMITRAQKVLACRYGEPYMRRDVPLLLELYQDGELLLDELVSQVICLDEVNDGLDALGRPDINRTVIDFL